MADTQRTLAQILALAADNTSGAISPQDLRDCIVSLRTDRGEIYKLANASATTATLQATWYLGASATALSSSPISFDMPSSGRLRYTGAAVRTLVITATFSYVTSANGKAWWFDIAKNGTESGIAQQRHHKATAANEETMTLQWVAPGVATNDYFEVWVYNEDAAGETVTLINLNLRAIGLIE